MEPYSVTGAVVDSGTRQGIPGLEVEAWRQNVRADAPVGAATTGRNGEFVIRLTGRRGEEISAVFFRVSRGTELLASTERTLVWTPRSATPVRLEVTVSPQPEPPSSWDTLHADSLDELLAHEPEILRRIAATANGGQLFLTHPFMLLADVGVELSRRAAQEIVHSEPALSALSRIPYDRLKAATRPQGVQVIVHGLFRRRSQ